MKEKKLRLLYTLGFYLTLFIFSFEMARADKGVPDALNKGELIEVTVYRLITDPTHQNPVVFLSDSQQKQALPIWISFFEANAIYSELIGIKPFRPLTHDLLKKIIKKVNGTVRRIVITHVKENVYYATIVMEKEGTLIEIDARPSDSIVLALKFKAPIFVNKTLFKEMAIAIEAEDDILKRYGLILQDLTPSLAQYFSFKSTSGVLVFDVREGSKAEKDGVKAGDIIVEIEKKTIENVMTIRNALSDSMAAAEVKVFRKTGFIFLTLHLK